MNTQVSYYSYRINNWVHGKCTNVCHKSKLCTIVCNDGITRYLKQERVYVNDPAPTYVPFIEKFKIHERVAV